MDPRIEHVRIVAAIGFFIAAVFALIDSFQGIVLQAVDDTRGGGLLVASYRGHDAVVYGCKALLVAVVLTAVGIWFLRFNAKSQ